jgi:Kef-type K+ transport system membrane component KefB
VLSLAIAFAGASLLRVVGLIQAPLLVAIMLSATSLGIVVPVLADAGQSRSTLGQLIIAGSSIADFGAVILLSLFFSGDSTSVGFTLLLIGAFVVLVAAIGISLAAIERLGRLSTVLRSLQDSSAQIRVRGALLFLIGFAVLAQLLELEIILGAFIAGTVLRLVDKDGMMTHPLFRQKLEAVGFGVFIPFFVVSGIQLDVGALLARGGARAGARLPLGPAARQRATGATVQADDRQGGVLAAAPLQATSLPFIVATTGIGMELGILSPATGAALVVAGLLSVVLFPLGALTLLRGSKKPSAK